MRVLTIDSANSAREHIARRSYAVPERLVVSSGFLMTFQWMGHNQPPRGGLCVLNNRNAVESNPRPFVWLHLVPRPLSHVSIWLRDEANHEDQLEARCKPQR